MMQQLTMDRYARWSSLARDAGAIDRQDAAAILNGDDIDLMALLTAAGQVRRHFFGDSVTIHILDNVRNGACPEDCGYCGQSKDSQADIRPYKLKSPDEIVAEARAAQQSGAYRFCMALSGRGPSDRDVDHMCEAIRRIKSHGIRTCLSAGLLDDAKARRLKEAGLDRLNHNLNTSRQRYPAICTTHTYDDRLRTLAAAREAGIGLCSGLIVGMGEAHEDLLDVIYTLRELAAESIPVNFLLPIEGNRVNEPLSGGHGLDPQFVLRVLCVTRLVNPRAEVRIAAGREHHLRSLQPMALWPANSLFMEGYLLTEGQAAGDTFRMIRDAGFHPVLDNPQAVPQEIRRLLEGAGPAGDRTTLKLSVSATAAIRESSAGPPLPVR
jgi:biotin synthase